jgi:uncharacterized protein YjiS (DUF1127 family)
MQPHNLMSVAPYWTNLHKPGASRNGLAHLAQALERMRAGYRRRRTYEDLLSRPDYLLRDIGVSRSDLQQTMRRSRR